MAGSGMAHLRPDQDTVVEVANLVVEFPAGRKATVHAVSDISFDLLPGETLGVLGESGCGKSTVARAMMQMPRPTGGSVTFDGKDLTRLGTAERRRSRARLQMIMQDPISSLNPRRKVKDLVFEGLSIWGFDPKEHDDKDRDTLVRELLTEVGLEPDVVMDRHPHELSGGQCQRVCIARAVMMNPKVMICDEPVSSLDVSVQAQILNLLERMKARHGLSMMFIAHDVSVVKNISDRVMVLYLGKTCEVITSERMHERARHPYTRMLLESVPDHENRSVRPVILPHIDTSVELPSPLAPPPGCRFHTRCPLATDVCRTEEPKLREIGPGQYVACHNVERVQDALDAPD